MDTSKPTSEGHDEHGHHHDRTEHCNRKTIAVNNKPVYVNAGQYTLTTIKKLSGVPLADDLDELIDCTLKPIPDDAMVTIRGCEIFISHVKDGGSS